MYYRIYTCISDLIHVLQSIYLYFGSYSCTKVPVGTISQNRSESYHIQGQIRLIQIRTLVLRRYRSHQIHIPGLYKFRTYPKTNRVVLYLYYGAYPCLTDLVLVLQNLFLYFRSYTCITELIHVFQILYMSYRAYTGLTDLMRSLFWYKSTHRYYVDSLYGGTRRYYWTYTYFTDTEVPVGTTEIL